MAIEHDLVIIPVLNKIDLPSADIPRVTQEIISLIGCNPADIIPVSAKVGTNVEKVLDAIVERIPKPRNISPEGKILPHGDSTRVNENLKV